MQILYCDVCGTKLPKQDASSDLAVSLCKQCAAKRGAPAEPTRVKYGARKSSAIRLRAIKSTGSARQTPAGGNAKAPSAPIETPTRPVAPGRESPNGIMGFYFCEKCGKRVTNADLAKGQGRDKQLKGVHCVDCAEKVGTMAFEAISQKELWA